MRQVAPTCLRQFASHTADLRAQEFEVIVKTAMQKLELHSGRVAAGICK
jgi:hypothetical protein